MSLRYLFGPVSAEFAEQQLQQVREQGTCLSFGGEGTDLPLRPKETWESLFDRFPEGWRPDFVALWLHETTLPGFLWSVPLLRIGLAPDCPRRWHSFRHLLHRCQWIFTDGPSVQTLVHHGFSNARPANLFGCSPALLQSPESEIDRDIDILHLPTQPQRQTPDQLPILGRLARLAGRRRLHFAKVLSTTQRAELLRRSRIVFNMSSHGECNAIVAEALASGTLLFQEAGNRSVEMLLNLGREYVAYDLAKVEEQLEYYLNHEEDARRIAVAGQVRASELTFEHQWADCVGQVESSWSKLSETPQPSPSSAPLLVSRTWHVLGEPHADPGLGPELESALRFQPDSPEYNTALAVLRCRLVSQTQPLARADLEGVASGLHRALQASPRHPLLALNMVEALVALGQHEQASSLAQQALTWLDEDLGLTPSHWETPLFPPGENAFQIEWERIAWHEGSTGTFAEVLAKRTLLRWQLHIVLAELQTHPQSSAVGLEHYLEAALTRPDLPTTRALLGCALGRRNQPSRAIPHLRQAVAANPFDQQAVRALHQALNDSGDPVAASRLAHEVRLLCRAAPDLVSASPWLVPASPNSDPVPTSPLSVALEGPLESVSSLGIVNRNLAEQLLQRGHAVSLRSTSDHPVTDLPDSLERALTNHEKNLEFHISHRWPPQLIPPKHGHWIVFQPWEFGSPPKEWIEPFSSQVDEVWVPSHFVRDCYVHAGIPGDRIHVIPLGVDPERFQPDATLYPLPEFDGFTFLFVGGTIHRKGIDLLLDAFAREFRPDEKVRLVIKDACRTTVYRGQTSETLIHQYIQSGRTARIEYLAEDLGQEEMTGLYAASDCLVLPFRGEGFGLPLLEAMASGLPVVVPSHGPALEICDEECAFFVPARTGRFREKRVGTIETVGTPWLAEPDPMALQTLLRFVAGNPQEAQARGANGRERVLRSWTWKHTAEAVEVRLRTLAGHSPRRGASSSPGIQQSAEVQPSAIVEQTSSPSLLRPRVSLCLIVRDEEQNLSACLQSAGGIFDEVIVVDTGSTDRTKELAQQAGAKLFELPWCDSFADARNESVRHATGDWIFWLDADDRLDDVNRQKLSDLFTGLRSEMVGYSMKCI